MVHWRDGTMNSKANKHLWWSSTKGFSQDLWNEISAAKPSAEIVADVWSSFGISHTRPPVEVEDFLPTPGQWFYTELLLPGALFEKMKEDNIEFNNAQVAYHGCSIKAAAEILQSGGLKTGVSVTSGHIGTYCERTARRTSTLCYATHVSFEVFLLTCVFELCADGDHGRTIHSQWVKPPDSVIICGVFTHVMPLTKIYDKGFAGWYRIHNSVFDEIRSVKM